MYARRLRSLIVILGLWLMTVPFGVVGDIPPALAGITSTVDVCFTPHASCQDYIVALIDRTPAPQSITVQAYSFTSAPIAQALTQAHKRGVKVAVLLDHSQLTEKYSSAKFFAHAGIPLAIDNREAIAHNKVIVFHEQHIVLTGSFNFTKSAQERNAENLVTLSGSPELTTLYLQNIALHWQHSQVYSGQ